MNKRQQLHAPQYRFRGGISPQDAERNGARAESLATADGDSATLRTTMFLIHGAVSGVCQPVR